jgi:large subunit ribosomal protein L22
MKEVKAKLRYLRIAPRKVRLVADLIRGKSVEEAERILNFTRKKAALTFAETFKICNRQRKTQFQLR